MDRYLLVFLGGGLGAMARFALGSFVARVYASTFPLGTFLINVSGSLLIGFLMALFQNRPALPVNWRLLLVTGILGGFTTFSSFEWEGLMGIKNQGSFMGVLYLSGSVLLGLAAAWLGWFAANRFWPQQGY